MIYPTLINKQDEVEVRKALTELDSRINGTSSNTSNNSNFSTEVSVKLLDGTSQIRLYSLQKNGSNKPAVLLLNDGTNFYVLMTSGTDTNGGATSARPLTINTETGKVDIEILEAKSLDAKELVLPSVASTKSRSVWIV